MNSCIIVAWILKNPIISAPSTLWSGGSRWGWEGRRSSDFRWWHDQLFLPWVMNCYFPCWINLSSDGLSISNLFPFVTLITLCRWLHSQLFAFKGRFLIMGHIFHLQAAARMQKIINRTLRCVLLKSIKTILFQCENYKRWNWTLHHTRVSMVSVF